MTDRETDRQTDRQILLLKLTAPGTLVRHSDHLRNLGDPKSSPFQLQTTARSPTTAKLYNIGQEALKNHSCVCKQPFIALYFESENELKFYNLEARLYACKI